MREKQKRLLASQLRVSLQILAHSLRAGRSLAQAVERAAEESDPPLANEWQHILDAIEVGQSLPDALSALPHRVPLQEMRWFVTSVQIAQSTGGSLASILDTLAQTLQEREALRDRIGVLTAQGKASGILLSVLPFALMGVLSVIAPEMVIPLFTTTAGRWMLLGVILGNAIGGICIHHITTIKTE